MGRSRDRGCKGHRILGRVLVGGRHLGLSRAISFHEAVVTATLAASSRRKAQSRERDRCSWNAKALCGPAEEEEATEVSEARLQWAPWEEDSHAPLRTRKSPKKRQRQRVSICRPPKRSRVRETPGSLVKPFGAQDSEGRARGESCVVGRERARYGYTQYRSGGRSRSDASRALPTGRSQDLLVDQQGASQKEARSLA